MIQGTVTTHFDEALIDAIFAQVDQCSQPGAAVGIAMDGVPVYRRGFGLAHMELPVVLGPAMRMRIGSTTKHFTALAYLLLCEEGRASLDDPVGQHLDEINEASGRVTMRQLMGHTSGIRDAMTVSMLTNGAPTKVTDADLLAYYQAIEDVDFAPETSWSYNNGGYVLLTAAIERITGETLDTVLRKRIFEPIGMYDTILRRWDDGFVSNSAALHFRAADGRFTRDYMGSEVSGAGGVVSTMDDMLRWLRHMDAPHVGSADSWRLLKEPHRLANGTSTGYGLGLVIGNYRGVETISHAGGVVAGNSQMIKVPAARLDISIAVNRADVNAADLANRIIDVCVEGLDPVIEVPFEKVDCVFVSAADGRVIELQAHGEMQLMGIDGAPGLPVTADEGGNLRLPEIMSFIRQSAKRDGNSLVFTDFGNEDRLVPVTPKPGARLGDRVGHFEAISVAATAWIVEAGEDYRLRIEGRHGRAEYRLSPVTDKIWKAASFGPFGMLGGIVTFADDRRGFEFAAGRMKGMRFTRPR
ncbi:CubicO group peptidase (beta-lactamase class C family) [Novosphingobium sp. PhB165]|uniref:serine hydrolase domain-containing protein n=1 Tax=Novosphingobium sp. PhB165 TaxID=2485105 RepID=UPI00104B285F|nr:serine hydrolase domain-containing protein [Novosphingobium sp. PhB165]TCM12845.1 CubicO group peptidase (beta-lactamase class C family) [Novosphingobium sp. PhB165]